MKTLEYWNKPRNGFSHEDAREVRRLFDEEASASLQALAQTIATILGHERPAPLHIVLACKIAEDRDVAGQLVYDITRATGEIYS